MAITLHGVMDGGSGCIPGVYIERGVQTFGKRFRLFLCFLQHCLNERPQVSLNQNLSLGVKNLHFQCIH